MNRQRDISIFVTTNKKSVKERLFRKPLTPILKMWLRYDQIAYMCKLDHQTHYQSSLESHLQIQRKISSYSMH